MKKKLFYGILIVFTVLSCSSDNDINNENSNSFNYNGSSYSTQYAFLLVNSIERSPPIIDISINLLNVDSYQTTQSSGVNLVTFKFRQEVASIQIGAIAELLDYKILDKAYLDNFEIDRGNTIIDKTQNGFMSTSNAVTIKSISETNINLDFKFTREDGEIIKGKYSGTYLRNNS